MPRPRSNWASGELVAGYLIFEIEITDPVAWQRYREAAGRVMTAAGGTFVVASERIESLEGDWHPPSISVVRFESFEQAHRFYHSAEYQELLGLRFAASRGRGILVDSRI